MWHNGPVCAGSEMAYRPPAPSSAVRPADGGAGRAAARDEGAVVSRAGPAGRDADGTDCRRESRSHFRMRSWRFA